MNGELEQIGQRWRLRFTRNLAHDAETVWRAITEPEHLKAWFPQQVSATWQPGETVRFAFDGAGVPDFEGTVLAAEPPRLLEYTWGPDTLRFEIADAPQGCVLTLFDTIDEVGKGARDAAGWHVCLDALEHHLQGTSAADSTEQQWKTAHAGYVTAFGPEAATIGPPEGWDG